MQTSVHLNRGFSAARPFSASLRQRRTWYAEGDADAKDAKAADADKDAAKDELPDWVKDPKRAYDAIQEARQENAKWRKDHRELEKRLEAIEGERKQADEKKLADDSEWKTLAERRAQELEALKADLKKAETTSLRTRIAAEFGLPPTLAARLQGESEDDLKADAEALKALIPAQQSDAKTPPGGKQSSTSSVPSGTNAKETDAQRRARLYGGHMTAFEGGGVILGPTLEE